jgi:ferric iron reductase protein FhuF
LNNFISDKLKKSIQKVELEVDNIRNKKIRGAIKKQKDMLKTLNDKLKNMRATRIKCEELAMTMSFLEGGAIKTLKSHLRKYNDDNDNDQLRENVDAEVNSLINIADLKRK